MKYRSDLAHMKPSELEQALDELDPGRKGKIKFHEIGDNDESRLLFSGIVMPTRLDVSVASASRIDNKRAEQEEELTEARVKVQEWDRKLERTE